MYRASQRISKLHCLLKSYSNFAEGVDFDYWWSCIGKRNGLCLQPAKQDCYIVLMVAYDLWTASPQCSGGEQCPPSPGSLQAQFG